MSCQNIVRFNLKNWHKRNKSVQPLFKDSSAQNMILFCTQICLSNISSSYLCTICPTMQNVSLHTQLTAKEQPPFHIVFSSNGHCLFFFFITYIVAPPPLNVKISWICLQKLSNKSKTNIGMHKSYHKNEVSSLMLLQYSSLWYQTLIQHVFIFHAENNIFSYCI